MASEAKNETKNVAEKPTNETSKGENANAGPAPGPGAFQTASLYVGDLNPDVTEALLFEIFNAVGPVASIRVCRDAVTRRSLGYAYVNFHNIADAERALDTMNYTAIKGRPCRIMWSQRDPSLRKSGLGNIFVKNLDASIDNKALYDTFSLFGNILSCKVATDAEGNSKGYGYVHYETREAAEESIAKINGMLIAGREVFVGEFQKRQERGDVGEFTNVYVKNIPKEWKDDDLKKIVEEYGSIVSAAVMPDANSAEGHNRGFGFINYEEPEAAAACVEALNGKVMKSADGEDHELYASKAQKKAERERELRTKFEQMKMDRIAKYQGVNLYVKNLDDTVTEEELREAFMPFGTITSTRVMKNDQDQSRGFGFVCFSTPEEATKAVTEMNGKLISGKPVFVALAQRKEVRRAQLEAQHAQQRLPGGMGMHPHHAAAAAAQRGMMGGQPPMYGAAPMFYAQPNQMPPQVAAAAAGAMARQGGFVYPNQMQMNGRGMRGQGQQYPRGQGYPMGANGQPMQNGPRGGPRRQRQNSGRGGNVGPRGGNQQIKYTANARNMAPPAPAANQAAPAASSPAAAPAAASPAPPVEPLTPAALAAASPEMQKNMIGERLYPLIHAENAELAGKITGMLLEMDNGELLHLLESPEARTAKITEAIEVLNSHSAESAE